MDELTKPPAGQSLDPRNWVTAYADYYHYAISRVNDEELARDLV